MFNPGQEVKQKSEIISAEPRLRVLQAEPRAKMSAPPLTDAGPADAGAGGRIPRSVEGVVRLGWD